MTNDLLVPTGTMVQFYAPDGFPDEMYYQGWRHCRGQILIAANYPELHEILWGDKDVTEIWIEQVHGHINQDFITLPNPSPLDVAIAVEMDMEVFPHFRDDLILIIKAKPYPNRGDAESGQVHSEDSD